MGLKIALIGDLIIDEYINFNSLRLSPEGPAPVVKREKSFKTIGGAGNVALSLSNLGLNFSFYYPSTKFEKSDKELLSNLTNNPNIRTKPIYTEINDINPIKTRYYVDNRQFMREDKEFNNKNKISILSNELISEIIEYHDILIVSDYQKGCINTLTLQEIIKSCNNLNKPVFIDTKNKNLNSIKDAFCLKINKYEFNNIFEEYKLEDSDSIENFKLKIKEVQKLSNIKNLVVTLGANGCISSNKEETLHYQASIVDVIDITGAGDAFISGLFYAFINKEENTKNLFTSPFGKENIKFANYAASSVVTKKGTFPIEKELYKNYINNINKKKIIGFTNGCFDILHIGHLSLLEEARRKCDYLIVGLNSDNSVKKLKGNSRPINNLKTRRKILESLKFIDEVIVFNEENPERLIKQIKPDLLIKGSDYSEKEIIGASFVKSYGGSILRIDLVDNLSSSNIINKIKNL